MATLTNFFNSPIRDMGFYVENDKWNGWQVRVQYAPSKTMSFAFLHEEERVLAQKYVDWYEAANK